jgi:glycosyltransferase involved in cell wall biosynthesis
VQVCTGIGCNTAVFPAPPNDPIAIVGAIEKLIALPEEDRRTLGKNGQQFVRANHSYEILAGNFIRALQ